MTLEELIELLREMPKSAEIAPVLVNGYDVRDICYERGAVRVETAQKTIRHGYDDED